MLQKLVIGELKKNAGNSQCVVDAVHRIRLQWEIQALLCCVDGVCSRVDFCHVFKCLLGTFLLLLFICGAGKDCKCKERRFSDSLGFSLGFSLRSL